MEYKNQTLKKYLEDLSAKLPAPGGGSAASLTAALGASLISMVINFTLGKPKYAHYEKELQELLNKSEQLRGEFLGLVDLDVKAYQSKNLRDALDVPFMTARLCFEAARLIPETVKKGNPNLATDTAIAAELLESGFCAAYFNVKINLKSIGDEKLSKAITSELDRKEKIIKKIRKDTEVSVGKIIRG